MILTIELAHKNRRTSETYIDLDLVYRIDINIYDSSLSGTNFEVIYKRKVDTTKLCSVWDIESLLPILIKEFKVGTIQFGNQLIIQKYAKYFITKKKENKDEIYIITH